MTQLPCEELFGQQRAQEVKALLVDLTGHPCPGAQGYECPLIHPDDGGEAVGPDGDAAGDLVRAVLAAQR